MRKGYDVGEMGVQEKQVDILATRQLRFGPVARTRF